MVWLRFFSWWPAWCRPPLTHLHFILYTRRGCHLCETATVVLQEAWRRHGFTMETIDIETDPRLVALYGEQVPVVAVNGKVRFRGEVNRVLLERLLCAERER